MFGKKEFIHSIADLNSKYKFDKVFLFFENFKMILL